MADVEPSTSNCCQEQPSTDRCKHRRCPLTTNMPVFAVDIPPLSDNNTTDLSHDVQRRRRRLPQSTGIFTGFGYSTVFRYSSWSPSHRLMTLAVLLVTVLSGSQAQFSREPHAEPYYVNEKTKLVLPCAFEASYLAGDQYELQWLKVVQGIPTVIIRGRTSNPASHYSLEGSGSDASYNLEIKEIDYDQDNGDFFCQLDGKAGLKTFTSHKAVVVVLVQPKAPEILNEPNSLLKEGERVEVTCGSVGGNPNPTIRWRWQNGTIVPEEWTTIRNATNRREPTRITLRWYVTAYQDKTNLECQVRNRAMRNDAPWMTVSTKTLEVQYKPMVTVKPSVYNVEEGTQGKLICSAVANPPPAKFQWSTGQVPQTSGIGGGGRPLGGNQAQLTFRADTSHQGNVTCKATNSIGESQADVTVNVLYAPRIVVPEIVSYDEGQPVYLPCNVSANPEATRITWIGPTGVESSDRVLQIPSITKQHAGTYTCEAENEITVTPWNDFNEPGQPKTHKRHNSAKTELKVRYVPGKAKISVSKSAVVEGDAIQLTCSTDQPGHPVAKYKWKTPNSYVYSADHINPLILNKVTMGAAGEYMCLPYNDVGDGQEGSFYLEVIQPPSWEEYLDSETKILQEGHSVPDKVCTAKGNPRPTIRWYKDGQRLLTGNQFTVSDRNVSSQCPDEKKCSKTITSSLSWVGTVRWNDSGVYECKATNQRNAQPISASQVITVQHRPVVINARYGGSDRALAAATKAHSARLQCIVSARPRPTFRWFFEGSEIQEQSGRFSFRVETPQDGETWTHTLQIHDPRDNDFGLYNCSAVNTFGGGSVIFQLVEKSVPMIPSDVRMISATHSSITVAWKPGFDGGEIQKFRVDLKKTNPVNGDLHEVAPEANVGGSIDRSALVSAQRRKREVYTADHLEMRNITGLYPFTTYSFRIKAENKLGLSEWTDYSSATTNDIPTDPQMPRPTNAQYDPDTKLISYKMEPTTTASHTGHCLMVYVRRTGGDPWRALTCLKADASGATSEPVPDMHLLLRYCREGESRTPLRCSDAQPVARKSVVKPSMMKVLVPILVVVAAVLLVSCVVLLCCCMRRQKQPQEYNKNNAFEDGQRHRISTLPGANEKPPMTNGHTENGGRLGDSVADSGVFTMGSQFASQAQSDQIGYTNNAMRVSYGEGADRWGNAADPFGEYSNDPYGGNGYDFGGETSGYHQPQQTSDALPSSYDFYDQYGNPLSGGGMVDMNPVVSDHHHDSGSVASGYSGGPNRRVMREIIV